MGILHHSEILKLHAAILSASLVDSRSVLLGGIPSSFVAGLPRMATPGDQILGDLEVLNATEVLVDGSVPLITWLLNALGLAGLRQEGNLFTETLQRCRDAGTTRSRLDVDVGGPLELIIFAGATTTVHRLPSSGRVVIGRAKGCDISISHSSVSRVHAALRLGSPLLIEDLGSANGTFIPDRVAQKTAERTRQKRQVLKHETAAIVLGDCITLGSVMIVIRAAPENQHSSTDVRRAIDTFDTHSLSQATRALYERALVAAQGPFSILIVGETGVGKEVLANTIHFGSPRAKRPFVAIDCAALVEPPMEREIFGQEKGALSGSLQDRRSPFETADGGTIFLDGVDGLPPAIQAKLLRVIEDRKVLRNDSRVPRTIDVRFISATSRDLEGEIKRGSFRRDLFFRLNGITLSIPPLRERTSEIASLAEGMIVDACRKLDRALLPRLSDAARSKLELYPWPGNIRELRNSIDFAVTFCAGDALLPEHFPPRITGSSSASRDGRVKRLPRASVPRAAKEAPGAVRQDLKSAAALGHPQSRKKSP